MLLLWLYKLYMHGPGGFQGLITPSSYWAGWFFQNGIARAMARITPTKNIACHEYNWNPRSNPRSHGL